MCQRHTLGRPWGAQHWPCISLENKLRTVQVGVIQQVRILFFSVGQEKIIGKNKKFSKSFEYVD
jgi:hypothetical protein